MILIAAVDRNWAIGNKDSLLVSIPEDQKRFRQITTGHTVVLGRKTLAGFPNGLPLKNRTNIILSANPEFSVNGDNAIIVRSEQELFDTLSELDSDDIYIIGGGTLYKMMEPYCDTAIITYLDYSYEADTYFPNLDEMDNWEMVEESEEQTYFSLEYYYRTYRNKSPKKLK
ncbi:dihydrofolate reductase [Lachnospiraceae bacterium NE2001]|nr:dihydrofolate reductase [Lachnospiraceae bacterium NE2001]